MMIISHVAVEFRNPHGDPIFTIHPSMLNDMITVPDAIRQDPIFDLLLQDGSIKAAESVSAAKTLGKQDPTAGITAEGKQQKPTDGTTAEGKQQKPAADSTSKPKNRE